MIRRGDIIELTCVSGYRNDGLFIWDGEKVMDLENDIDDYGNVPQEFKVLDYSNDMKNKNTIIEHNPEILPILKNLFLDDDNYYIPLDILKLIEEFSINIKVFDPKHWDGMIDHNSIVWFDYTMYLDELIQNLSYEYVALQKGWVFYTFCKLPYDDHLVVFEYDYYEHETVGDFIYENEETKKLKPQYLANLKVAFNKFFKKKNECSENFFHDTNDGGDNGFMLKDDPRFKNAYFMSFILEYGSSNPCPECGQGDVNANIIRSKKIWKFSCSNNHKWEIF